MIDNMSIQARNNGNNGYILPSIIIDNSSKNKENVAAKSTEVNNHLDDIWLEAGKIVKDWESAHHAHLRGKIKDIALYAAYIQLTRKRGFTRNDLQNRYNNYNPNYARRKMYLLWKEMGLLVPLKGRRSGRFQQYCISTELDKFKDEGRFGGITPDSPEMEEQESQYMKTLIRHFVACLSRRKLTFHKLSFYIKLPQELYDDLYGWPIPSSRNKAKVKEFHLDRRRTVKFEIYPEGGTVIYMVSTANAYELHKPKGLVDFFSALGEARSILKAECNGLYNIPEVPSWKLKFFDKDKTIPVSELEKDIPQVMRLWSNEGIRIELLGEVFQLYGKVMPETGPAFRLEVQSAVDNSENKDLADTIITETFPEIKLKSVLVDINKSLNKIAEQLEKKQPSNNADV
jgi:hypothetical protein